MVGFAGAFTVTEAVFSVVEPSTSLAVIVFEAPKPSDTLLPSMGSIARLIAAFPFL